MYSPTSAVSSPPAAPRPTCRRCSPSSMLATSSIRSLISRAFSAFARPSAWSFSRHNTMCTNMALGSGLSALPQRRGAGVLEDEEAAAGPVGGVDQPLLVHVDVVD